MTVSHMSNPCKMNSEMFPLQTGQYLCVFISHEKYVSLINTEFEIFIMSTPTKFFPFLVRNHFY